jgi:PAS domain S-box-containing protein
MQPHHRLKLVAYRLTLNVFLMGFLFQTGAAAQGKPIRRILVLNEAGTSNVVVNRIDDGIRTVLDNSPYKFEFYREYLETILFPNPADQKMIRDFFVRKYQDRKPDVIVAVGPSPFRFMIEIHQTSFPKVPVIFCVVSEPDEVMPDSDFTGVEFAMAPTETMETALKLLPDTKHVIVVGGTSDFDRWLQATIRNALKPYGGRLNISYLTDLPMSALLEQLRHLPDHTIVLQSGIGRDAAGTVLNSTEVGPMVATAANAPIFSLFDVHLNHGEVGGDVINFMEHGKTVGAMALRILGGADPKEIPVAKGPTTYMFDSRALKRWGLNESHLPAGSMILNREPGLWEAYKEYLIISFLVFLAQSLLIAGLLWQRKKRRQTEAALKKSEERFYTVFRRSPLAVTITRLQDNCYLDVNEAFVRATGWSRDEIIGRTPFDVGLWLDPEQRIDLQCKVMAGTDVQNLEFLFRTRTGEIKTGLGSADLIEIDGVPCVLSVATDITERKQIEEKVQKALREGEQRFRVVANSAPVMIWMSDVDKFRVYFNQRWLEFTGRPLESELGNGWAQGVYPEDFDRCLETYTTAFDRRDPFQMEYRLRRYGKEYRWVRDSGVPRYDTDGSFAGYIGSAADVTDNKKVQEALSSLSGRLIEAQEQERHHLARELHDDIGQRLALLSFGLQDFNNLLPDFLAPHRTRLQPLMNEVENICKDLRELSHRLHSVNLETLGLEKAMRGFCRELAEQRKVKITFTSASVPDHLSPQLSLHLFRILQEGLNNAVKHSSVRTFEVQLERVSDYLQLTIRDHGVGFDPTSAMHSSGIGLISMRERASFLKGTLSIVSKPQSGTEIKVRVPLAVGDTNKESVSA